jgi:tetratricopeptide (TPR) repeat protein
LLEATGASQEFDNMMPGLPLVVDAGKRKLSSVIEWGRRKMLEGAYDVAIQHFSIALDLKPGLIHALVSRGFCHLTLGDEDKAQKDFAEVIAKDAGFNRNVYVLIALCFKRNGDYHTAIRYLSRCVQQFASFKPALVARGELNLKVREFEKARKDFQQVLHDSPGHLVARRGLGDAFRGLGNFREALRQYTKAVDDAMRELQMEKVQRSQARSQESGTGSEEAGNSSSSQASGPRAVRRASSGASITEVVGQTNELEGASDDDSSFGRDGVRRHNRRGNESSDGEDDEDDVGNLEAALPHAPEQLEADEVVHEPGQIQAFITEVLLRRALLLRLIGDLDAAGADLLEVLQADPQNGLALFWYAKVLIEQHRHREAPAFLQACIHHLEEMGDCVHALLGTLLLTHADPDCSSALRHLKEAVRLAPPSQPERSQPIRITMWVCAAACTLQDSVIDAESSLSFLDRALAALSNVPAKRSANAGARPNGGMSHRGQRRPRSPLGGSISKTPRGFPAGSGGNAVAALSIGRKSIEEATWLTAKALVWRRQELAQGDDLDLALECSTYFQLVARDPQQQTSVIPPLLYALRAVALCYLGRWEDCCMDCRRALELDPEDEATQYNMHIASGILRSRMNEFEPAVGRFTKAIRLRPVSTEVRVHRAIAFAMAARACSSGPGQDQQKKAQFLTDALQDLEAAEQQALIVGASVPSGTSRLRTACLCNLGRVEEAWEVLQQLKHGRTNVALDLALEAEVLILMERYAEAGKVCSAMIASDDESHDLVAARVTRGRCYSELGMAEPAFEDFRQALVLAPERADVHETIAELYLRHSCFQEALTAFNTAAKLAGAFSTRLSYSRAIAHLALGSPAAALKDLARALRLNPNLPAVSRTRDGAAALQMCLDGDWRHAHVRLNVLLHPRLAGGNAVGGPVDPYTGIASISEGLPPLFLNHELVLYRGVCSLYLGDSHAAAQDFQAALELAQQNAQVLQHLYGLEKPAPDSADEEGSVDQRWVHSHPVEVTSEEGQAAFECEMMYNITLCHLLGKDHRAALSSCEALLERSDSLDIIGPSAQCLIWFLVGVCRVALGEGRSDAAREAFMHSYSHDPVYVDDFLRRHEPNADRGYGGPSGNPSNANAKSALGAAGGGATKTLQFRPIGGCPAPPPNARLAGSRDVCDAAPEAVCCLRREPSRLSARFPPCRFQVKDVVIWGRPSVSWPFVRMPELVPSTGFARLDLLSHLEVGVNPASPWDGM